MKKNTLNKILAIAKTIAKNNIRKIGAFILVLTFVLLGLSFDWSCDTKKGISCSGSYDPPDPKDVKRIIK